MHTYTVEHKRNYLDRPDVVLMEKGIFLCKEANTSSHDRDDDVCSGSFLPRPFKKAGFWFMFFSYLYSRLSLYLTINHWVISQFKLLQVSIPKNVKRFTRVLNLCVEFQELSHLTRDLSEAEKKINVVTSWANAQNDLYFSQTEVVILGENICHIFCCSACNNSYFLLSLR